MTELELLSGAKNADIGIEAIKHGADAVYIGAEKFGARAAAGNSLSDIKRLIAYAHIFHARVYVTINTILMENELKEARDLICRLYEAGADAILVQDMGIFEMDIPPIALHASTQTDNCTIEKVRFLESIGCSQVVLARECSLEQIKAIRNATKVKLEAFVHGALCVSFSGRCYASQALCGRSANRGDCAQICRLPFDLQDGEGHSYGTRHWLSLKDLNLSQQLGALAEAGISSFKIEGRLKDVDYVKNITAHYSNILNEFIKSKPGYCRSSDGETRLSFTPDPQRSFNRGFTQYFFYGRKGDISSSLTPKSIGMPIGTVSNMVSGRIIEAELREPINKQDGICYFNKKNEFCGFKTNKFENGKIYAASELDKIEKGAMLYRNFDSAFVGKLAAESAKRLIGIDIKFSEKEVSASDGKITVSLPVDFKAEAAEKDQSDNIKKQLGKLGGTNYFAKSISVENGDMFFPSSLLSGLRRELCEKLNAARVNSIPKDLRKKDEGIVCFMPETNYTANISNSLAERFYKKHGTTKIAKAFELEPVDGSTIMWCKHCLKYAVGACQKHPNDKPLVKRKPGIGDPMFLIGKKQILRLRFNCKNCEMEISED